MVNVVIRVAILFIVSALFFLVASILNGLRKNLIRKAAEHGARENDPWIFVITEVVLVVVLRVLSGTGDEAGGNTYVYVLLGLMAMALLVFVVRRLAHPMGDLLLAFARIPLDLIYLVTFGIKNETDMCPPELNYFHKLPVNIAQKGAETEGK